MMKILFAFALTLGLALGSSAWAFDVSCTDDQCTTDDLNNITCVDNVCTE